MKVTRRQLLQNHDNNYGFNPDVVLKNQLSRTPPLSVSVVIPYYETGVIFERCLHFLSRAIDKYKGSVEVIVVDDGSTNRPISRYLNYKAQPSWLKTVVFSTNKGRTEARNAGLEVASKDIVLFLDSDILIDEVLILNHVKLQTVALANNKRAICVSFFEFTDKNDARINKPSLTELDLRLNDFRIKCKYGPTWVGCDEDKQFIGQRIKTVSETNYFRNWHGQYKAWMLPNMVLGGAFSVWRSEILAVNGFDLRFKGYGFTETSAATQLVAERNNVVVPCIRGGGLHVNDEDVSISQKEKDIIFRKKHDFYFNVFLEERVK